jgi:hypothetical protein
MVNPRVLEYDTLIAVNQLKLHETATVTLALKNIAMSFPAADYSGLRIGIRDQRSSTTTNSSTTCTPSSPRWRSAFPIHLAITVGHPAMIATGPLGGHTIETGLDYQHRCTGRRRRQRTSARLPAAGGTPPLGGRTAWYRRERDSGNVTVRIIDARRRQEQLRW